MTIGTTNQTEISYIKEVTPGTTPATPAMQLVRMTGESLNSSNDTNQSEEIRTDRGIPDLALVDQNNAGAVNFEMSGLTFDDWLEGALLSDATWSTDTITASTIAADATGFTDSGNGFVSAGFEVGQFIKVTGFTDTTINIFYRITAVVAGDIDTYPVPPGTEVAGNSITIESSNIKNGTTDASYTIQKGILDVAAPTYMNFRGMRISSMSLDMSTGSRVTGSFNFMGLTSEVTETQISGLTQTAKTTTEILSAVTTGTEITAVNAGLTTALQFTSFSLSYDNANRQLKAIGTLGSVDIRPGTINATATINPYFETKEILQEFLDNNEFSLAVHMVSGDGYDYFFSMPKVKFLTQTLDAGSRDADLIVNSQVQLLIDANASVMVISKFTP